MKWTLVLLASLLFVATVVRAEEEGLTSIEEVKDELPQDEEFAGIEEFKDELPQEEDEDETDITEKDDAEGVLSEMTDKEEEIPQSETKLVSQI